MTIAQRNKAKLKQQIRFAKREFDYKPFAERPFPLVQQAELYHVLKRVLLSHDWDIQRHLCHDDECMQFTVTNAVWTGNVYLTVTFMDLFEIHFVDYHSKKVTAYRTEIYVDMLFPTIQEFVLGINMDRRG